jgi:hypothetical protein
LLKTPRRRFDVPQREGGFPTGQRAGPAVIFHAIMLSRLNVVNVWKRILASDPEVKSCLPKEKHASSYKSGLDHTDKCGF